MRYRALAVCAAVAGGLFPAVGRGQGATEPVAPPPQMSAVPRYLAVLEGGESVYPSSIYARPTPPRADEGVNEGGVNLSLTVNYLTDYVYRGIDRSEVGGSEDAPNLQFDGALSFNLGKLPHPVVGVFVNVYNDDPVSRFQEVRPFVGFDWNLRPLTVSAGWVSYIFPEREDQNTSEVYAKLGVDDSFFLRTDRPLLSPYVFAAYDYDRYDGLYLEAGVRHDFPVEDTGVIVTAIADIGYSLNDRFFTRSHNDTNGFQHYDVGLIGTYSLNTFLNLPRRYGEYKLKGYLYYTDGIDNDLRADSQIWGGVGINFEY